MPQMGESIAEGTLSRWLKKVGDSVKRDEPIFEISTDKVDAEIPAASNGVLIEILVQEGQTVAVQTVVARLETDAAVAAEAGGRRAEGGGAEKSLATVSAAAPISAAPPPSALQRPASPPPSAPRPPSSGNGSSFEERLRTKSSPLV